MEVKKVCLILLITVCLAEGLSIRNETETTTTEIPTTTEWTTTDSPSTTELDISTTTESDGTTTEEDQSTTTDAWTTTTEDDQPTTTDGWTTTTEEEDLSTTTTTDEWTSTTEEDLSTTTDIPSTQWTPPTPPETSTPLLILVTHQDSLRESEIDSGMMEMKTKREIELKQQKCDRYEEFNPCGSDCLSSCDPKNCSSKCSPGCFCTRGFARMNGKCIPSQYCSELHKCAENEMFSYCGTQCPLTCDNWNIKEVR